MTAAELIRGVRDMVWSELAVTPEPQLTPGPTTKATDAAPLIRPERRGMQATHLQVLARHGRRAGRARRSRRT